MSRIESQIYIELPAQRVYDYVSTPARWPEWHPSSLRLDAGAERPLAAGARFEEDVRVGKREGRLSWLVREARAPRLWIADAEGLDGLSLRLRLRYDLDARGNGTSFRRTLDYEVSGLWQMLMNQLVMKRRISNESAQSLHVLKRVIEAAARAGRL
ncbi:MAG: hypothetical protein NVS9B10_18840 [Nevskia sp.]